MKARAKILLVTLYAPSHTLVRLPVLMRRAKVEVHLLAPEGLVHVSRYVHSLPVRPANADELVRHLREHLATAAGEYQLVLIGDDRTFAALSREKDRSWLVPWFPVDPFRPDLEAFYLKHHFNELCHRHGLPAPRNIVCRDLEEAQLAAEKFGYPVMLKNSLGAGGYGVRKADNPAALEVHYAELLPNAASGISVQEFLTGQLGDSLVLARRGAVRQWFSYEAGKAWPTPLSPLTQTTAIRSAEADELCFRLAQITGYHGLFGFDWMRSSRDGRLYLLEFNPRMTPAVCHGKLFGLDVADNIGDLWCEPPPAGPPRTIRRTGFERHFPQDILRCIDEGDWRGLLANAWDMARLRAYVPWGEPRLLVLTFREIAVHFLKTRTTLLPRLKALRKRLTPA